MTFLVITTISKGEVLVARQLQTRQAAREIATRFLYGKMILSDDERQLLFHNVADIRDYRVTIALETV